MVKSGSFGSFDSAQDDKVFLDDKVTKLS